MQIGRCNNNGPRTDTSSVAKTIIVKEPDVDSLPQMPSLRPTRGTPMAAAITTDVRGWSDWLKRGMCQWLRP